MSDKPYTECTPEEWAAIESLAKTVGTIAAETGVREKTALKKLQHKGFSRKSPARLKVKR